MQIKHINRATFVAMLGAVALAGCTVTVPENGGYPPPGGQPYPQPHPASASAAAATDRPEHPVAAEFVL
jgi:hypothetical protein